MRRCSAESHFYFKRHDYNFFKIVSDKNLCFVVELSGLFPLESVVLSLAPEIDQVGDDERRDNVKEADTESPEGVGDEILSFLIPCRKAIQPW